MKKLLLLMLLLGSYDAVAQNHVVVRDSLSKLLEREPSFSIYKDNYAVVGFPLNARPTKYNSNIKYVISFKQRLTNAVLPLNSFLFITYTQKAFWDIFRSSKPFAELNYNPGAGITIPIFGDNVLRGAFSLMVEHESNGRDSIWSRSWNNISLAYDTSLSPQFKLMVKGWVPFAWRSDNPDLMKYIGYGEVKLTWIPLRSGRIITDFTMRKGASWDSKGSIQTNFAFKISKDRNQYFGFNWYVGNAESLIEYQDFVNIIRFGLIIKARNKGVDY